MLGRGRRRGRHSLDSGVRFFGKPNLRPVYLLVQSAQHTVVDTVKYRLFRQEFHFCFGGMNVYIHRSRRQIQMEHAGGKFAHHDLVAVGLFQGGNQKPGFHRPVVYEKSLQIPAGTGIRWAADKSGQGIAIPTAFHRHHPGAVPAIDAVHRCLKTAGAGGGKNLLSVPQELKRHLGMGQGLKLDGAGYPGAFHRVRLHEFHPCRGVVEQIPDDDGSAFRTAHFGFIQNLPCLQMQTDTADGAGGLGHQINPADRGNGGQSFPTESHSTDGGQILRRAKFGGGMAEKRRPGVLRSHAAAVVCHPEEGHASVPDFDGDFGGSGVHGIFQQFLDHTGRTLHHFSRGD